MDKVVKVNIESRQVSLLEGSNDTSLFKFEALACNALYLQLNQKYTHQAAACYSMLSVFQGTGELAFQQAGQTLSIQLVKRDIVFIPAHTAYSILNVAEPVLMISELLIG